MLCRRCYRMARGRGRGILDSLAVARTCLTQRTHRLQGANCVVAVGEQRAVAEAERILKEGI